MNKPSSFVLVTAEIVSTAGFIPLKSARPSDNIETAVQLAGTGNKTSVSILAAVPLKLALSPKTLGSDQWSGGPPPILLARES